MLPLRHFYMKLLLFPILLFTAFQMGIFSTEMLSPVPAIEDINYTIFSNPSDEANDDNQDIRIHFSFKFGNIGNPKTDIESIKIFNGSTNWTHDPSKLVLKNDGRFETYTRNYMSSINRNNSANLLIGDYTATVKLKDGTMIERAFQVLPPGEIPLEYNKLIYTESYRDFLSPWHIPILSRPRIESVRVSGSSAEIGFIVTDERTANVRFEFTGIYGNIVSTSDYVINNANGIPSPDLNNGNPLKTDGSLNTYTILIPEQYIEKNSIAAVRPVSYDGKQHRGISVQQKYAYRSAGLLFHLNEKKPDTDIPNTGGPAFPPAPEIVHGLNLWDGTYFKWLTGLSGMLSTINSESIFGLSPESGKRGLEFRRDFLRRTWSVNSREDLLRKIDWCLNEGDSVQWEYYRKLLLSNTRIDDNISIFQINIIKKYMNEDYGKNLLGWDYCRAVALVRWGFSAGYLDSAEAWGMLENIGNTVSVLFDSWEDYGRNYILGRIFYYDEENNNAVENYINAQKAYTVLLKKDGPWKNIPWETGKERGK